MLIYNPNHLMMPLIFVKLTPTHSHTHSLPETTGETTAVADSGRLRNIEEAGLGVDALLHCAAPLARISLPVKVNVVVQSGSKAGLLKALTRGAAHTVSAGEGEDLGREDLVQQAAGVDGVESVASTLVVRSVLCVTEERANAEGGAGGQVG